MLIINSKWLQCVEFIYTNCNNIFLLENNNSSDDHGVKWSKTCTDMPNCLFNDKYPWLRKVIKFEKKMWIFLNLWVLNKNYKVFEAIKKFFSDCKLFESIQKSCVLLNRYKFLQKSKFDYYLAIKKNFVF